MGEAYFDVFWVLPDGTHKPLSFFSFPYSRTVHYLLGAANIFFKITQYWFFFFIPFLLYKLLFPNKSNIENNSKTR
ncbi:MAG: hypothetical protein A2Y79_12920 [Deltaproteobacteria bacterium RBG_13_43_22]|nr:MAG: hypothetical protein A2Y79_12920 [Deltaproteobacteria bacterium RBG_13_43_22]